jgi:hypothetical protein
MAKRQMAGRVVLGRTVVIRKAATDKELYLDSQGKWRPYKHAKHFETQTAAERFAAANGIVAESGLCDGGR